MDFSTILNDENDNVDASTRRASRQNSKHALSSIRTDSSAHLSPRTASSPLSAFTQHFPSPISPPVPPSRTESLPAGFVATEDDVEMLSPKQSRKRSYHEAQVIGDNVEMLSPKQSRKRSYHEAQVVEDGVEILSPKQSRKRSYHEVEVVLQPEVHVQPEDYKRTKRVRKYGPIPIWAQRCKGTKPLPKYAVKEVSKRNEEPARQENGVPQPYWEPTFTNVIPHDYITRVVSDFLFGVILGDNNLDLPQRFIEIEGKIGEIVEKGTGRRVDFGGASGEMVIAAGRDVAFRSVMSSIQHAMFNEHLNDAVRQSLASLTNNKPSTQRNPVTYVHTRERDSFHSLPDGELSNFIPGGLMKFTKERPPRLRITTDQKTGQIIAQIIKIRIADLHIHSPQNTFDWRISVNAELPWQGDAQQVMASSMQQANGHNASDRNKDRMSYQHQACRIDLTQVKPTSTQQIGAEGATHELEVELDAAKVREHGALAAQGRPNMYEDIVGTFVNNVRILVRMG